VLQWLFFEQYSHEPNIATSRFWISIRPLERNPFNVELLAQKHAAGVAALGVMNEHLRTRAYFVGERYSIADIALYAYTHKAGEGGFDLAPFPAVEAWLDRVRAEPRHVALEDWQAGWIGG
jgi:glutathione S-transferase